MSNVAIIVPALNEAGNIRKLVTEIRFVLPAEIIVVDNGSTDETAAEALAAGARVITEPRRGYGYACAAGTAAAEQADVLVFIDGDFSFLPSELPIVLQPILTNQADLVLGSRILGGISPGTMPPQQRVGNWLVANLMNSLYGMNLTDLGPYRSVRRSFLLKLDMQEMIFGWPVEMIVKSARSGARLVEVPVSYHNRRAGHSKVSGTIRGSLLAGWFFLNVVLRYAGRR